VKRSHRCSVSTPSSRVPAQCTTPRSGPSSCRISVSARSRSWLRDASAAHRRTCAPVPLRACSQSGPSGSGMCRDSKARWRAPRATRRSATRRPRAPLPPVTNHTPSEPMASWAGGRSSRSRRAARRRRQRQATWFSGSMQAISVSRDSRLAGSSSGRTGSRSTRRVSNSGCSSMTTRASPQVGAWVGALVGSTAGHAPWVTTTRRGRASSNSEATRACTALSSPFRGRSWPAVQGSGEASRPHRQTTPARSGASLSGNCSGDSKRRLSGRLRPRAWASGALPRINQRPFRGPTAGAGTSRKVRR